MTPLVSNLWPQFRTSAFASASQVIVEYAQMLQAGAQVILPAAVRRWTKISARLLHPLQPDYEALSAVSELFAPCHAGRSGPARSDGRDTAGRRPSLPDRCKINIIG